MCGLLSPCKCAVVKAPQKKLKNKIKKGSKGIGGCNKKRIPDPRLTINQQVLIMQRYYQK
jgi:hypothetical protein